MSQNVVYQDGVGFADIFRNMRRRKILLLLPPILGLLGAEAFLKVSKPRYLAEAQVLIENQQTSFDRTTAASDPQGASGPTDRMVASQVSAMKSEDIMRRVVDKLALDQNPEYNLNLRQHSALSKLQVQLGFKDDPALFAAKPLATKTLISDITVYPVPDSDVIGVKSVAGNGEAAAQAANALVDAYVLSTKEASAGNTNRARDWMSQQIDGLRQKVQASEQAVEQYRNQAGLLHGQQATLNAEQLSQLNQQIAQAESARADAIAKAEAMRKLAAGKGALDGTTEAMASPILQRLKDQQATAIANATQLSVTYLPNHPKMMAAQQQVDAINAQLRTEARKVADSLQTQAQVADQHAASLRNDLEKLKSTQATAGISDVQLKSLEREADANRQLLQTMLARYAEANARVDTTTQPGFARIIQRATAPATPYFPKPGPTLALAGLAGLFMGFGLAFIAELLSQPSLPVPVPARPRADARRDEEDEAPPKPRRSQAEQVADYNGDMPLRPETVPPSSLSQMAATFGAAAPPPKPPNILAVIPAVLTASAAASLVSNFAEDKSGLAAATAPIANKFMSLKASEDRSSFAIASLGSAAPNAALAAIAIGRKLASQGAKVVMIDLAATKPGVEGLLAVGPGAGLGELLAGSADFTSAVGRDRASDLHFIRGGNGLDEKTLAQRLPSVISALKAIYGYVLVNLGEARAISLPLMQQADATILMALPARVEEAVAATKALEEASGKAFVVQLDPKPFAASQPEMASA